MGEVLRQLIERGYDRLPLPGSGDTLLRWRLLAAVAARDLGLVKLFEGHTDALAILAELGGARGGSLGLPQQADAMQVHQANQPHPEHASQPDTNARQTAPQTWGVWAAEAPDARLIATRVRDGDRGAALQLNGTKAWCSGARVVSHTLVTAWLDDQPILAAVALKQSSVSISTAPWQAVGMRATQSGDVHFDGTPASQVGARGAYVGRPGFWQGGAGIAACWYGAAAGIAGMLADAVTKRPDAHRHAHLGEVDIALTGAAEVLRASAAQIDANPGADHQITAMRARLAVEAAATEVMHHAGRALGAAPLCRNQRFARAMADLAVFLRQSHAERDLAALGEALLKEGRGGWAL
ncbi:acyl-CoA dehydrogenase [Paraburkholderia sp. DHOC27]|nr:acyl-CoA dehydrogenase [Paraburkholderia sp. DHOC27]